MKRVYVVPNIGKDPELTFLSLVCEKLIRLGMEVLIHPDFSERICGSIPKEMPDKGTECLITLGGDGTVLDAFSVALMADIPVLGINIGHIGYLTELERDQLDDLVRLRDNDFTVEEKMLLSVISDDGRLLDRVGLNEVYLTDLSHNIVSIDVGVGGELVRYRADGVVVATPVGSTGYALSCGGPVVAHGVHSISVVPVCPHTFFNRALLLSDEACVVLKNAWERPLTLLMDGRALAELAPGGYVTVARSEKMLKMLSFAKDRSLSTLFKKLKKLQSVQE